MKLTLSTYSWIRMQINFHLIHNHNLNLKIVFWKMKPSAICKNIFPVEGQFLKMHFKVAMPSWFFICNSDKTWIYSTIHRGINLPWVGNSDNQNKYDLLHILCIAIHPYIYIASDKLIIVLLISETLRLKLKIMFV